MNDLTGINESLLDNLIVEVKNYAEETNKVFIDIDDIFNSLRSFYKCENNELLFQKYDEFRLNFPVISENILNVSSDLLKMKFSKLELDKDIEKDVSESAGNISL